MTINTKEEPGAFDIMAEQKAAPDEPKFTLWARDPLAAPLVREWAQRNRDRAFTRDDLTPEKLRAELVQSTDAEEISWQMDAYRRGEKVAEAARPATYSGATFTADELAAKDRHDRLVAGSRKLDNAVADTVDQVNFLESIGRDEECERLMRAVAEIKAVSEAMRPTRASAATQGG